MLGRLIHRLGLYRMARLAEALVFGTRVREFLLGWLWRSYHRSLFRRQWVWTQEGPHFENNWNFLNLWYTPGNTPWPLGRNPDFLARGLYVRELIKPEFQVLDLGCGDGFYDYLFFSGAARHIDAIDIDAEAIRSAKRRHQASNITFHLQDCVSTPFPQAHYDLVVWDGAIAHFKPEDIRAVMEKIRRVLPAHGVLAGSEALEDPDHRTYDHHVVFPTPKDLRDYLIQFFPHVVVKEIPPIRGRYREAYFRCATDPQALKGCEWS